MIVISIVSVSAQVAPVDPLVSAVRPALPFPAANTTGDFPEKDGSSARWFVVWPGATDEQRIIVKANPLHPETQAASAVANARIQRAVEAAERKAQAAYDRAIEEVKKTGKSTDVDGITLEDEGVEGERIDAELELIIELAAAQSFEIASSIAPTIAADGTRWQIRIAANTYREKTSSGMRERFRAAETRIMFGLLDRPAVTRRHRDDHFVVAIPPSPGSFAVVIRGNEQLLKQVVARAAWTQLAR